MASIGYLRRCSGCIDLHLPFLVAGGDRTFKSHVVFFTKRARRVPVHISSQLAREDRKSWIRLHLNSPYISIYIYDWLELKDIGLDSEQSLLSPRTKILNLAT